MMPAIFLRVIGLVEASISLVFMVQDDYLAASYWALLGIFFVLFSMSGNGED